MQIAPDRGRRLGDVSRVFHQDNRPFGIMNKITSFLIGAALCSLFTAVNPALAQGTAFTYQGQLQNNNSPVSGTFNLTFCLYTNSGGGTPIAGRW